MSSLYAPDPSGLDDAAVVFKQSISSAKFIIFDTRFLVFDTQFLGFIAKFVIFTHRTGQRPTFSATVFSDRFQRRVGPETALDVGSGALYCVVRVARYHAVRDLLAAESIVYNTQFLDSNTKILDFNTKFIIFLPGRNLPLVLRIENWPKIGPNHHLIHETHHL